MEEMASAYNPISIPHCAHGSDGVKGSTTGTISRPQFVWENHTLYFATDPVALNHIGWEAIDAKRVSVGGKKLVDDTPDQYSTFVHRQPEHVENAGALEEWGSGNDQR